MSPYCNHLTSDRTFIDHGCGSASDAWHVNLRIHVEEVIDFLSSCCDKSACSLDDLPIGGGMVLLWLSVVCKYDQVAVHDEEGRRGSSAGDYRDAWRVCK